MVGDRRARCGRHEIVWLRDPLRLGGVPRAGSESKPEGITVDSPEPLTGEPCPRLADGTLATCVDPQHPEVLVNVPDPAPAPTGDPCDPASGTAATCPVDPRPAGGPGGCPSLATPEGQQAICDPGRRPDVALSDPVTAQPGLAGQDPVVVVPAPVEPPPVDAKQHLLPVPGATSLSDGGPPVAPPAPPAPPAEPGKQQEPAAPVQPVAAPPPPPPPRKSDRSNNEPAPVEAAPAQIVPAGLGITLEAVPKSPVLVPPPGFVTAAPQISLAPDTSTEINLDQLAGGSIFDGGQNVLAPEPAPAPDMGAAAKVAADIGAGAGGSQPAPAPPADTGAVRYAAAGLGGGAGSPPAEPAPATFDDPCNSTIAGSGPC